MRPLGRVLIRWSPAFAYAIGLMVTDGNMSPDGRHLSLVSKDVEQLEHFMECLSIRVKIGKSVAGSSDKAYWRVQSSDRLFYDFLLEIGLMPNKSKIIGDVAVPREYFFDFLRGHFDGDGSFYSYWDPRWRSSFMYYLTFVSASQLHILWLRSTISSLMSVSGHISKASTSVVYQLRYGKNEALQILKRMYYDDATVCLGRKRVKVEDAMKVASLTI